ncbi:MAG: glycoside hydrolase family 5 protein [Kiritimatiellae bacterium]|nr:glycoside hydrolase family 5 protein [Kiritimatiellia bacterium]
MKKMLIGVMVAVCGISCAWSATGFLRVKGHDIVDAKGETFFIRGTNLGNWLNPEGYMFGFKSCNSGHFIDEMFKQLVGPEETAKFWRAFKDAYITEADIAFVAKTGSNTIRLPFHYKLFTDEDYLGLTGPGDGFKRVDDVVGWCRKYNLKLILDMHDCPGGQTGDNIDDSYGYPWLFESESFQKQYCDIWRMIAKRYADETVILGYDLMNEPISSRLADKDALNAKLEAVQKRAVAAIREVDRNHIVMLAGAQWNSNFAPFTDWTFDANMLYTCHRYWTDPKQIGDFTAFRQKTGLPLFMGETGHNTYEWYRTFTETMEKNNIGWTYWPLKAPGDSSWLKFPYPEGWKELIVTFAESDRKSYAAIQKNRPDRKAAVKAMRQYIENCRNANCTVDKAYLSALGLKGDAF